MRSPRVHAVIWPFLSIFLASAVGAEGVPPRTLIIALDAVPYRTVAHLTDPARGDDALFPGMHEPVPVISTFPSTTSLAFAGLLEPVGLNKSPGYEARFYDWQRGKVRGGGLISYNKIEFPWREFWDWSIHGAFSKMVSSARPTRASYRSIRRSLNAFAESDDETFFVYYTTTDIVSHLESPPGLEPVLRRLDEELRRLRAENPDRPFRTVLFSDHGMDGGKPLSNVRKGVRRALRQAGYRPAKRLRHENHVVFVPFGLVSSFVVFTRPELGPKVAEVIGNVEGVHFCVTPEGGDTWHLESGEGRAKILRRQNAGTVHWAYEAEDGDPLKLLPVARELATSRSRATRVSATHVAAEDEADDTFFTDDTWFEATRDGEYPDPFYRIARGFDLVENTATAICSLEPGYMYGAKSTVIASLLSVGRLKWTHGALDRDASLGFLMTDAADWERPEGALRFNEALVPFVDGDEAETALAHE